MWRSSSLVLAGTGLGAAARLGLLWFAAVNWGADVQGATSVAIAVTVLAGILMSFGLEYANGYLVGSDPSVAGSVALNSSVLAVVGIALVWPLLWVGVVKFWASLAALALSPSALVGLTAVAAAMFSVQQTLQAVALASGRYQLVFATQVLAAAGCLLGALAGAPGKASGALCAWIAGVLVAAVVLSVSTLGRANGRCWSLLSRQLKYGVRAVPGNGLRALNMRLSLYALAISRPLEVGVYGIALSFAEALLYLPGALGQVMVGRAAAGNQRVQDSRWAQVLIIGLGLLASLVAGIWGGRALERVFGPDYRSGGGLMACLMLAATFHGSALIKVHERLGRGEPLAITVGQLAVTVISALSCFALIPSFGAMGAAVSVLLGYLAFAGVMSARWPRHLRTVSRPVGAKDDGSILARGAVGK